MTTICVIIEDNNFTNAIINKIIQIFPCFYEEKILANKDLKEVTFKARVEDAKGIERLLGFIV